MIVDDTEENIDILVEALADDYEVCVAMDGETALQYISAEPPDLVLLDIMMPGLDGFEVCRRLKDAEKTRDIPIIFVTAMGKMNDMKKGLELGAMDYITKPITPSIVKVKVKNQLMLKLAHSQELDKNTAAREKVEKELRAAREIQMDILPKVFSPFPGKPEIDLYAVLQPARQVGGDFYDFFFNSEDQLCFVIGDVSGKGVPAALFMAAAKTLIKSTAHTVLQPDRILDIVNRELSADNDTCTFVTVFLGILDSKKGRISYVNAGHNPPLIILREGEPDFLKGAASTAIGIYEDSIFTSDTFQLMPGETILLYTDGVTEAFNQKEEQFSEERLQKEAANLQKNSMRELVTAILREVESFTGNVAQSDDITMLALKYLPVAELTLVLKNERPEIQPALRKVTVFLTEHELSPEIIHDFRLSLEEILENIINHAYEDDGKHHIEIEIELTPEFLTARTKDDGKPFDPTGHIDPDKDKPFAERQIGGLGIHLVRSLMDEIKYSYNQGRNVTFISKSLS